MTNAKKKTGIKWTRFWSKPPLFCFSISIIMAIIVTLLALSPVFMKAQQFFTFIPYTVCALFILVLIIMYYDIINPLVGDVLMLIRGWQDKCSHIITEAPDIKQIVTGYPFIIRMPVYLESFEKIIKPSLDNIRQSLSVYEERTSQKSLIILSDDGLAKLAEDDGEDIHHFIVKVKNKPFSTLTNNEKEALSRISYYEKYDIGWLARPREGRKGVLFKKTSNLYWSHKFTEKMDEYLKCGLTYEEASVKIRRDSTFKNFAFGGKLTIPGTTSEDRVILYADKDIRIPKDTFITSSAILERNPAFGIIVFHHHAFNEKMNYFTRILGKIEQVTYDYLMPANALFSHPLMFGKCIARESVLKEVGYFTEDQVIDDISLVMETLAQTDKQVAYVNVPELSWGESVSSSFSGELPRQFRFGHCINQLYFNRLKEWFKKGVLKHEFKRFLLSDKIPFYMKLHNVLRFLFYYIKRTYYISFDFLFITACLVSCIVSRESLKNLLTSFSQYENAHVWNAVIQTMIIVFICNRLILPFIDLISRSIYRYQYIIKKNEAYRYALKTEFKIIFSELLISQALIPINAQGYFYNLFGKKMYPACFIERKSQNNNMRINLFLDLIRYNHFGIMTGLFFLVGTMFVLTYGSIPFSLLVLILFESIVTRSILSIIIPFIFEPGLFNGVKIKENETEGSFAYNPLEALSDKEILRIFKRIIENRYDVRVLSERYNLGEIPAYLTYKNEKLSVSEYVQKMMDFLVLRKNENPHKTARAFRKEFPNMARPIELDTIFERYMDIKIKEFDVQILLDLIPENGIIADIGAGKNKLGRAILNYSDENNLNVRQVIGTDIIDWTDKTGRMDKRLSFIHQKSTTSLPLPSNTFDLVIVKWVLHHMSDEDQKDFIKSIKRILKPGGKILIFEALGATDEEKEIVEDFNKVTADNTLWPEGSFYNNNLELSKDFMKISPHKQKLIHALEDYFGHNLVMGRDWMPQLFTYKSTAELQDLFKDAGFKENKDLRCVYGLMPIIRIGPPSIRLVFEKQAVDGEAYMEMEAKTG